MSAGLIALVGVIYVLVGIDQFFKGSTNMAIMYFAYALANVGLYMEAK